MKWHWRQWKRNIMKIRWINKSRNFCVNWNTEIPTKYFTKHFWSNIATSFVRILEAKCWIMFNNHSNGECVWGVCVCVCADFNVKMLTSINIHLDVIGLCAAHWHLLFRSENGLLFWRPLTQGDVDRVWCGKSINIFDLNGKNRLFLHSISFIYFWIYRNVMCMYNWIKYLKSSPFLTSSRWNVFVLLLAKINVPSREIHLIVYVTFLSTD